MNNKSLLFVIGLIWVCVSSSQAFADAYRIGPVYTGADKKEVSMVVEVPPGITLAPSELTLVEDGNPTMTAVDVKPFRDSGKGMALLICLDISGSIGKKALQEIKDGLEVFLKQIDKRELDSIGLVTFGSTPNWFANFSVDQEILLEKISDIEMQTKGFTVLYDALHKGIKKMEKRSDLPARKRIIVISDGKDEKSSVSSGDVIELSKQASIPVDAISYGKIEPESAVSFERISVETGGFYKDARSGNKNIMDEFWELYDLLMKDRSLVVWFRRDAILAGEFTKKLSLQLVLSGGGLKTFDSVSAAVPRTDPSPPVEPKPVQFDKGIESGKNLNNTAAPVITAGQTFTLDKNKTSVGFVKATDTDSPDSLQDWRIVGGTGAFAINATSGEITVADAAKLDYDKTTPITLDLRVGDGVNDSAVQSVTIEIKSKPTASWLWALISLFLLLLLLYLLRDVLAAFLGKKGRYPVHSKAVERESIPGVRVSTPDKGFEAASSEEAMPKRPVTQVGHSFTKVGTYFREPVAGHPGAFLVGVSGPAKGRKFGLEASSVHIGADMGNEVCISDDAYMSGVHAYLRYEQGRWYLSDQGSSNGTFINDDRVLKNGIVLDSGDHIRVGESVLEISPAKE